MKKIISLLLALAMLFSFAACGSSNESTTSTGSADHSAQIEPEVETTPAASGEEPTPSPEETPDAEVEEGSGEECVDEGVPTEPVVESTPAPQATPAPEATPQPTPEVTPEPTPQPTPEPTPEVEETPAASGGMDLQSVIDATVAASGLDIAQYFSSYPVTTEDAPYVIGYNDFTGSFAEAMGYGPLMGSIPFVMVLFRLDEGADAEAFAADIEANADLRKWICVEAEVAVTAVRGDLVLFVMSETAYADVLIPAFNSIDIG